MLSANNTWSLLLSSALLASALILSGCSSSGGVTSVDPCVEIPFIDGAEGACVNTVSHKSFLVPAAQWKEQKKTMIMLSAAHWTKIKLDWLKGCRMLIRDEKQCNVALDSVDQAIKHLTSISSEYFKE